MKSEPYWFVYKKLWLPPNFSHIEQDNYAAEIT